MKETETCCLAPSLFSLSIKSRYSLLLIFFPVQTQTSILYPPTPPLLHISTTLVNSGSSTTTPLTHSRQIHSSILHYSTFQPQSSNPRPSTPFHPQKPPSTMPTPEELGAAAFIGAVAVIPVAATLTYLDSKRSEKKEAEKERKDGKCS